MYGPSGPISTAWAGQCFTQMPHLSHRAMLISGNAHSFISTSRLQKVISPPRRRGHVRCRALRSRRLCGEFLQWSLRNYYAIAIVLSGHFADNLYVHVGETRSAKADQKPAAQEGW